MTTLDDWAYSAAPEDDEGDAPPNAWCVTDDRPAGPDCERRGHRLHYVDE